MKRGLVTVLCMIAAGIVSAQSPAGLEKAVSLQNNYEFDAAVALCRSLSATASAEDLPAISAVETACTNGANMLRYACRLTPVSSKTVPRKDFYLWFDQMKDEVWLPAPNAFTGDTLAGEGFATWFDPSLTDIVFSAPDSSGNWRLLSSSLCDTAWSLPQPLPEAFSSAGNEIFPIVSPDGRKLYFASDGLAGMGGYDIYVSSLGDDGRSWSVPENLGFPYSSPADDLMYMDTPDGRYSMLASNRACGGDSVTIYVFRYENSPISSAVGSAAQARRMAAFIPDAGASSARDDASPVRDEDRLWLEARGRVERIADSVECCGDDLLKLMQLQRSLVRARQELLAVETSYLERGVTPPSALSREAETSAAPTQDDRYVFHKNRHSPERQISIVQPEPGFDYTFAIGPEAVIVDDATLPDGVWFQVQICTVSKKLPLKKLRGMTPVFEVKGGNGKWTYYAGLFDSYGQMQKALPKIKNCGFNGAFPVAWKDGRQISIKTARQWNP